MDNLGRISSASLLALPLATVVVAAGAFVAAALVVSKSRSTTRRRMRPLVQRRTSIMSAMGVDRSLLKTMGMRQNVVNTLLFFEKGDTLTRAEMVQAMMTLARRFERMRSRPKMLEDGKTCVWEPIADLEGAVERAVTEDLGGESVGDAEALWRFERYKSKVLLGEDEDGRPMPYWRVILLSPTIALVRIDHCIGDGLTLVTLLREVGTKENGDRLRLGDLSPLLKRIDDMGDWKVALRPWKLLWLPNLWRAVSFIALGLRSPVEPQNPLRPLPEHFFEPVPAEKCGTVYFPVVKLSLLKRLARMAGGDTTINDVVLVCLADAFRAYFDQVGVQGVDSARLLLPIANPLPPSLYGNDLEGLCNHMTPILVPLKFKSNPRTSLDEIKWHMLKVKKSNAPILMTVLNTISDRLLTVRQVAATARDVWDRVSCVYSTVPGPTEAVSIAGHSLTGIQIAMPHPTSIFQFLSYDDKCFFNITLDTRSASRPWLLRSAFVDAIQRFASAYETELTSLDLRDDVQEEIDKYSQSEDWGGRGVVFTCDKS